MDLFDGFIKLVLIGIATFLIIQGAYWLDGIRQRYNIKTIRREDLPDKSTVLIYGVRRGNVLQRDHIPPIAGSTTQQVIAQEAATNRATFADPLHNDSIEFVTVSAKLQDTPHNGKLLTADRCQELGMFLGRGKPGRDVRQDVVEYLCKHYHVVAEKGKGQQNGVYYQGHKDKDGVADLDLTCLLRDLCWPPSPATKWGAKE